FHIPDGSSGKCRRFHDGHPCSAVLGIPYPFHSLNSSPYRRLPSTLITPWICLMMSQLKALPMQQALCLALPLALISTLLYSLIVKPILIQRRLNSLGIKGPPYRFFYGNSLEMQQLRKAAMAKPMPHLSHQIYSRLQPHLSAWSNTYGPNFVYWIGRRPFVVLSEPETVKQVGNDREKAFRKVPPRGFMKQIAGDGLLTSEGEKWTKMRKLANLAFLGDSLKNMIPAMVDSTEMMLQRWKSLVGKEVDVFEEFRFLTAQVISRTAFGTSYLEGEQLLYKLTKLAEIASASLFRIRIPGISECSKIYKSRSEIEANKLEQGIRTSILGMIRKREEMIAAGEADNLDKDFLGLLVRAHHESNESKRISVDDVVDECKTFYLAGHETTNTLLAWVMLLLSIHTDWQDKAREEVLSQFGSRNPDADGIAKLKTLSMIINETLRLYPPAIGITRQVVKDVKLGKLTVPGETYVTIDTMSLHHDPKIWGEDAHQFNPERFREGVAKATKNNPSAYLPFGLGVRICVGSSYTANEAKIAISMILQRYTFTLSPTYIHSPAQIITVRPQHGVQVILRALH
ncbi:Cytochrome P450 CYP749A22, partial [Linum grandiflorum]